MTDVRAFLGARPTGQHPFQVVSGYVSLQKPAPASFTSTMWVVIPNASSEVSLPFTTWPASNGTTLPAQGNPVVIAYDENHTPYVVTWSAATAFTGQPSMFAPGDLKLSAVPTAPTGWLVCDGTSYASTLYVALFAAIGYAYGGSAGTFLVPDFRGRAPVGVGTGSGLSARALGNTGGEETHLLTVAESAAHSHTLTDSGHTHTATNWLSGTENQLHSHTTAAWRSTDASRHFTNQASGSTADVNTGSGTNTESALHNHYVSGTTDSGAAAVTAASTGGGGSHNNMQPFTVANYFIKT